MEKDPYYTAQIMLLSVKEKFDKQKEEYDAYAKAFKFLESMHGVSGLDKYSAEISHNPEGTTFSSKGVLEVIWNNYLREGQKLTAVLSPIEDKAIRWCFYGKDYSFAASTLAGILDKISKEHQLRVRYHEALANETLKHLDTATKVLQEPIK